MDAYYAVVAAVPSAVLCPPLEQALPHEAQALPLFVAGICGCATLAGLWALGRRRRRRRARQAALADAVDQVPEGSTEIARTEHSTETATRPHNTRQQQYDQEPRGSRAPITTPPSDAAPSESADANKAPDIACDSSSRSCEPDGAPLHAANGTSLNPRVLMMLARDVSVHASWAPAYDESDA